MFNLNLNLNLNHDRLRSNFRGLVAIACLVFGHGLLAFAVTGSTTFAQGAETPAAGDAAVVVDAAEVEATTDGLVAPPSEVADLAADPVDGPGYTLLEGMEPLATADVESLATPNDSPEAIGCVEIRNVLGIDALTGRARAQFETNEPFYINAYISNTCSSSQVRVFRASLANPQCMDCPASRVAETPVVSVPSGRATVQFGPYSYKTQHARIPWGWLVESFEIRPTGSIYEGAAYTTVAHGEIQTPIPTPVPTTPTPPAPVQYCKGKAATHVAKPGQVTQGTSDDDVIVGTSGADEIDGKGGADTICGLAGDDRIDGGDGSDHIDGGAGKDRLQGGHGADGIYGSSGDDIIYGHFGDDYIEGGTGNDFIQGDPGNDKMRGDDGDDDLYGGDGADTLYGGVGRDDLYGDNHRSSGAAVEEGDIIYGGPDGDNLYGQTGADGLWGDDGDDFVYGGSGNDRIYGRSGHDWLYGEGGDDDVFGDDGNDRLLGAGGWDTLDGLGGTDYCDGGYDDWSIDDWWNCESWVNLP